ncbi:WhiB family transcriptional regulator [Micromonospora sp. LHW51205]|uniref:WhiB family transcriptional regulator n=1 Tax=Micromonospora sp. LHW51205 TaxID=2248752 RepID=UPI001F2B1A6F|nr:WhiB family transcriptional regulator [Micromonospora sp. LHW51205]
MSTEAWMAEGICRQVDGDLWFPEKGGSPRAAKAICFRCPVQEPCLRYALDHDDRFGIYGGKTSEERRELKRKAAA